MPRDYMLDMVEEFGRTLRAVLDLKNENPVKAMEIIATAFHGTKFRDKAFFDSLSADQLGKFIEENNIDYRSLDLFIDLLLEEIDIIADKKLLISKVDFLIQYTYQKEREHKIFSLKRNQQQERLKHLLQR
ncbi:hypothetical protein GO495_00555 [Chitinophaga oryziterrae]|uniref:Uncharacterized protein n=1 Tax=Chitinophaga oryziterrae TaxID=1031224 RepID=A0A6N8J1H0_9BACT|nr:hypothetical protein [Chitinophaga oryziterrae]MVT39057.1 hypothetical protein [Chitinophaga oryziterrae]